MPTTLMTSSWLFPPQTREVQFDEKWAFVGKKQKNCDPNNPDDDQCGDYWDFVAYDPEHRLVLAVVPGARTAENAQAIVEEVQQRVGVGEAPPALMTSDELSAYTTAIEATFGVPMPAPERRGPGRPRVVPELSVPPDLCDATVHKERENGRVVAVERKQVFGTAESLEKALDESSASQTVNTSFVERHHGTDRGRNARKSRKTYQFSKDWEVHEAMTYFTMYSYNFCWPVRTLRIRNEEGAWQPRTPAMAAGLTDHVWSLEEWLTFPAFQSS
jgi:IS1 family transposase